MIVHHPDEAILLDYGAGNLPESLALVVATHVSICALCSESVRLIELCGADLLDSAPERSVSEHVLDDLLERLDMSGAGIVPEMAPIDRETKALLPSPLRRYVQRNFVDLDWRPVGASFEEHRLQLSRQDAKAALYRFPAASTIPTHTHWGREYIVVLAGRYRDDGKEFGRGDFSAMGESTDHAPLIIDDCICLLSIDGSIKFSGAARFVMRFFQ